MAKYTAIVINVGGATHEIETSDDVFAVLKFAMRLKHADMVNIFGLKDYLRGEIWTVVVVVEVDEVGNIYDRVGGMPFPVIFHAPILPVKTRR